MHNKQLYIKFILTFFPPFFLPSIHLENLTILNVPTQLFDGKPKLLLCANNHRENGPIAIPEQKKLAQKVGANTIGWAFCAIIIHHHSFTQHSPHIHSGIRPQLIHPAAMRSHNFLTQLTFWGAGTKLLAKAHKILCGQGFFAVD